uniref:Uncharacterized protein n=1 Tax=Strombidium inclinatum TaxID=197538 RepID=A0A7S3MZD2_9SPIT
MHFPSQALLAEHVVALLSKERELPKVHGQQAAFAQGLSVAFWEVLPFGLLLVFSYQKQSQLGVIFLFLFLLLFLVFSDQLFEQLWAEFLLLRLGWISRFFLLQ